MGREFPIQLLEFYTRSIGELLESEKVFKNMKKFIEILPSSCEILKLMQSQKNNANEMMFMKLIIDIMENYYKSVEKPLFTKLQQEVFPLALTFYTQIDEKILNEVNNLFKSHIDKSNSLYTDRRRILWIL